MGDEILDEPDSEVRAGYSATGESLYLFGETADSYMLSLDEFNLRVEQSAFGQPGSSSLESVTTTSHVQNQNWWRD